MMGEPNMSYVAPTSATPATGKTMVVSDEFERANVAGYIWGTTFPWGGRLLSTNGEQQLYLDSTIDHRCHRRAVVNVDPFQQPLGRHPTISADPTPTDARPRLESPTHPA